MTAVNWLTARYKVPLADALPAVGRISQAVASSVGRWRVVADSRARLRSHAAGVRALGPSSPASPPADHDLCSNKRISAICLHITRSKTLMRIIATSNLYRLRSGMLNSDNSIAVCLNDCFYIRGGCMWTSRQKALNMLWNGHDYGIWPPRRVHLLGQLHSLLPSSLYDCADYL